MQQPPPSTALLFRVEQLLLEDVRVAADKLLDHQACVSLTKDSAAGIGQHMEDELDQLTQQVVKVRALRAQHERNCSQNTSSTAPGLGPAWAKLCQLVAQQTPRLQRHQAPKHGSPFLVLSQPQSNLQLGDGQQPCQELSNPLADGGAGLIADPLTALEPIDMPSIMARPPPRAAPAHMMPPLVPAPSPPLPTPMLQPTASLHPHPSLPILNTAGHEDLPTQHPTTGPGFMPLGNMASANNGHTRLASMEMTSMPWGMPMRDASGLQGVNMPPMSADFAGPPLALPPWLPPFIISELSRLHSKEGMHPMAAVELLLSRVLVTPDVANGMLMWAVNMQQALRLQHSGPGPPGHLFSASSGHHMQALNSGQYDLPSAGMAASDTAGDVVVSPTRAPIFMVDRIPSGEKVQRRKRQLEQQQTDGEAHGSGGGGDGGAGAGAGAGGAVKRHQSDPLASVAVPSKSSSQARQQEGSQQGARQQQSASDQAQRPLTGQLQPQQQQAAARQAQQPQTGHQQQPSQKQQQDASYQARCLPPPDRQNAVGQIKQLKLLQQAQQAQQSQQSQQPPKQGAPGQTQQQQQQQQQVQAATAQSSVAQQAQKKPARRHPPILAPVNTAPSTGAAAEPAAANRQSVQLPQLPQQQSYQLQQWQPMLISQCQLRAPLKETNLLQDEVIEQLAHSAPDWCVVMSYSIYDGVVLSQVTSSQLLQLWSDGLLHVQTLLLGTQRRLTSRPPAELFRPLAFLACAQLCGQSYEPVAVEHNQVVHPALGWCCPPCLLSITASHSNLPASCSQTLDACPFWMLLEAYDEFGTWRLAGCSNQQQAKALLASAVDSDFMPCLPLAAAVPPRFWAPTSLFLPVAALTAISQQLQRTLRGVTSGELASINYDNRYAACAAVRL